MDERDRPYFLVRADGRERLATENLAPGRQVYGERLVTKADTEYRVWEPHRSKLAAAILNGMERFPFAEGTKVLYLGTSSGTTASHVSDIVGPRGTVYGVEHSSRVARDFLDRVVPHRGNIVPILQDARRPSEYFAIFGKVDVVYADIAQPDQTEIAVANCEMFLRRGGMLLLVIKIKSIDSTRDSAGVIGSEIAKLGAFEVLQSVDLRPYHKYHAMAVARYVGQ